MLFAVLEYRGNIRWTSLYDYMLFAVLEYRGNIR